MLARVAAGSTAIALIVAGCASVTAAPLDEPALPSPSTTPRDASAPPRDASAPDDTSTPPGDASDVRAADADAGADTGDGGQVGCNPAAVRFVPPGGALRVGQLCDDVVACASSDVEAAAVMAASKKFRCQPLPSNGCPSWTCLYADPSGPSVLDETEIAEICRVTVLSPTPRMTCFVYL